MSGRRFSILIPSWNNLPYLKFCVESLRENSSVDHEIILHLNDGSDGSRKWAESEGIPHTQSDQNVGICKALNRASKLATTDYIAYFNDDMVALPGWDASLSKIIDSLDHSLWFLSATMIEPVASRNPSVIAPKDYGTHPDHLEKQSLMRDYRTFPKADWRGASWPPNVVPRSLWEQVGGYSEEFSPGISSDPDFSCKLWHAGVRHFQGVGDARVYHFQSRSTGKVVRNDGRKQFLQKWRMTQSTFTRCYLQLGSPWKGPLKPPSPSLRLLFYSIKSKLRLIRMKD